MYFDENFDAKGQLCTHRICYLTLKCVKFLPCTLSTLVQCLNFEITPGICGMVQITYFGPNPRTTSMFFSRLSKNRCRQGDTSQVRTILCVKKTRWKWHTLNCVISRTSQGATKPLPGWFGLAGKQNGFKQTSGKKCESQKFALNCLSLSPESHVGSPEKTANVSNIFPTEKYVQNVLSLLV